MTLAPIQGMVDLRQRLAGSAAAGRRSKRTAMPGACARAAIAELCLADPRVQRVDVAVDKPGALRFARSEPAWPQAGDSLRASKDICGTACAGRGCTPARARGRKRP